MRHRKWTPQELHRLFALMKTCFSWAEIASHMPGRTADTCAQQAHMRGHYLNRPHTGPTRREKRIIRQRHAEGWSDMDIALELQRGRETVGDWRRKMGLPSNAYNQRHRQKTRQGMLRQIQEDGHQSLAAMKQAVAANDAWRQGWPADCTPLMVEILDHLERGASSRRGFCEATGRRYHDGALRTTGGKSAFGLLERRGHIRRLPGRVPYARGGGHTEYQFELAIKRRAANLGRGVFADAKQEAAA